MHGVLRPNDLDKLALIRSFFKYWNLNLNRLLEIPIRVYCIYCYFVTTEDTYSIYTLTHILNLFGWIYLIIRSICLIQSYILVKLREDGIKTVFHYLSHFMKQKEHIFINSKSVVQFLNKKNIYTETVNKENKYIIKTNALNLRLGGPWVSS